MQKVIVFWLYTFLELCSLYLWLLHGNIYAANLFRFWFILGFISFLIIAFQPVDDPVRISLKLKGRPVPGWIINIRNALAIAALAAFGKFAFATIGLLNWCSYNHIMDKSE